MASKAKDIIISTFLELIENNNYDKISVTMIVSNSSVSRQTFYYHFNDIENMIESEFGEENDRIYKALNSDNWNESAKLYVDLLNKYDTAFVKISKTDSFVFVYNLIYSSFYKYIEEYYKQYHKKAPNKEKQSVNVGFLISYTASAIAGLVMLELQKENRDYEGILNTLWNSFTSRK